MKKFLQFITLMALGLFVAQTAHAQLPDGSIAPDFTVTDINGGEHNLYEYLDNGYTVIMDVSATWCPPCWAYHESGTLEEVWENHGPAGMTGVSENTTDDIMIFHMEADDETTLDDLNGTGGNTAGDWVTGTHFPICDDTETTIYADYQCSYYPTIFTICPSRLTTLTGTASASDHYEFASQASCSPAAEGVDGALYGYAGEAATCTEVDVVVTLANTGTEPLTSATIEVTGCNDCPLSYDWSGDLETWETEEVNVGSTSVDEDIVMDVNITSTDLNAMNNTTQAPVALATDATTQWFLTLNTDCWPEENAWEVTNDAGTVVASAAEGSYANMATQEIFETFNVGSVGCYTFKFSDGYGDGLHGALYASCGVDGNITVSSAAGDIYYNDGSYAMEEEAAGANATVVSVNELTGTNVVWQLFPNPTDNATNVQFGLDVASEVVIEVYNVLGERVLSEDLGTLAAGQYNEILSLGAFESGVYVVNLNANGNVSTQRVSLN